MKNKFLKIETPSISLSIIGSDKHLWDMSCSNP